MLSVIIATLDSERTLLPTLAALVPGATSGLVSEVIVADGGSRDDTAAVADAAGCNFRFLEGPLAQRLKTAAAAARAPWLLFLRPGTILDAPWTGETSRFVEQPSTGGSAAVFRRGTPPSLPSPASGGGIGRGLREALSQLMAALGARPRPEQGLVIAKQFYDALGGHCDHAGDSETDLIRRIDRRRIVTLSTSAFWTR